MAKPSRTIIYAVVGAIVLGAIYFLTEPDATTVVKKKVPTSAPAMVALVDDNATPEDLKAHFHAYKGARRNSFLPLISTGMQASPLSDHGKWALTGISAIDGAQTALMENSATSESIFLKPGDVWNGQRVVAIGDSAVTMDDESGHQSIITFPTPDSDSSVSRPNVAPTDAPSTAVIGDLPPAPVTLPPPPGFEGPR